MKPTKSPYSFEQLDLLILTYEAITGKKPVELMVTPQFYTWFIQENARTIEYLKEYRDIDAKLPSEHKYLGVPIIKRPKIHT